jgi:hypothetical protein
VINISNFISKDNPPWPLAQPSRTAAASGAPARGAAATGVPARAAGRRRPPSGRTGQAGPVGLAGRFGQAGRRAGAILATIGAVLVSWLAVIPRRLGDRLFAMNDTEAYWWSWQIAKTRGGLARRYRDLQFDTLAECPQCGGSGVTTARPCPPCLGTGRITLGKVS